MIFNWLKHHDNRGVGHNDGDGHDDGQRRIQGEGSGDLTPRFRKQRGDFQS